MSGSPEGPTELDFKGSGCDPEVFGGLGTKNCSENGFFWSNLAKF